MIRVEKIAYQYPDGEFRLEVESLVVDKGESIALIGPSGAGKTTLLNLLSGILVPDGGSIRVNNILISERADFGRRDFRLKHIGLVFQEFELIDYLSVIDNVLLPYQISYALPYNTNEKERAVQLLERVGMADKQKRYPHQLSQGERQRVGLCRALLPEPIVILADEPTGNLDPMNSDLVVELMAEYSREQQCTVITVTHEQDRLEQFQRVIDVTQLSVKEHG